MSQFVSRSASQRTLLIRADANVAMGTGHVMRCLALAQAWQDASGRALLAGIDPADSVRDRLRKESIAILDVHASPGSAEDAEQTVSLAREQNANWVAVDGYQFGAAYQQKLKSDGIQVLFLDDYGHAEHYFADIVLNQNTSADEKAYTSREPYTRLLLGPKYCLLRREFTAPQERRREIAALGHRVLVTMGGSDPENFTQKTIDALNLIADDDLEGAVVAGGGNARSGALEAAAAGSPKNIRVLRDVSNMAELMAWADVAASGAGTTSWELCVMGLPSLLIDLAENQTPVARELDRRGCAIHLGNAREVSSDQLAGELNRLLKSQASRQALSLRCRELLDGNGARRIVSVLCDARLRLRPAEEKDSRLLWKWANSPQVRAASFSTGVIPWETHAAWFAKKLEQNGCRILIAEDDKGTPVGQVRFDARPDGDPEIDVSIAEDFRGQGLAASLIRQAAQSAFEMGRCTRLHAFIKPGNIPSVKAFEQGGFKKVGMDEVRGHAAVHFICEAN